MTEGMKHRKIVNTLVAGGLDRNRFREKLAQAMARRDHAGSEPTQRELAQAVRFWHEELSSVNRKVPDAFKVTWNEDAEAEVGGWVEIHEVVHYSDLQISDYVALWEFLDAYSWFMTVTVHHHHGGVSHYSDEDFASAAFGVAKAMLY